MVRGVVRSANTIDQQSILCLEVYRVERCTRVVCRTFDKRGKSLTPESRMSIELSRSWREVRRDATDEDRESAIVIFIYNLVERLSRPNIVVV